jgi:putative ABC transport system permease protein
MRVSASAFAMFGVDPQRGRVFGPAEDEPGHDVVVISDAFWKRRFGGRESAVGATMRLNGRPFEIIGVMPRSFRFMNHESALWAPIQFTTLDRQRDAHSFLAAARLKPGATFEAARSELAAIAGRLEREHPQNRGETATITRMAELGIMPVRQTLLMLLGAVLFVLLIACVNVANLLLAQGAVRQREFAVRAALGAGRRRLASQLVAEGLVLALAGSAAGVLLAWAGTTWLSTLLPPEVRLAPFRDTAVVVLDPVVLTFTASLAVLTALFFGLAPAVSLRADSPAASINAMGTRGSTAGFQAMRSVLLALQVGLALIVLAAAGLLVKSMGRLLDVNPGLDARNVVVLDMALPQEDTYGPPERPAFCAEVERQVGGLPGVTSVGAISHLPLGGASAGRGFVIEGRSRPAPNEGPSAAYRLTCPGYFAALGIPVLRGRDFIHGDTLEAAGVAIVNQTTADAYWRGGDPVGQRIRIGAADSTGPWLTIVGVVGNVRHFGLDTDSLRELYRPYSQRVWPSMTVTVKTAGDPGPLVPSIRAALAAIDRDQPILRARTMEAVVAESLGGRRFPMLLLASFSVVALTLAAIGVYGVVTYLVSQRTREIGIRMALGARPAQVVRLILGRSMIPIVIGTGCGLAGSVGASRLLGALLFRVTPHDPVVLAGIAGVILASALAACLLPARRAARVDPLTALRQE